MATVASDVFTGARLDATTDLTATVVVGGASDSGGLLGRDGVAGQVCVRRWRIRLQERGRQWTNGGSVDDRIAPPRLLGHAPVGTTIAQEFSTHHNAHVSTQLVVGIATTSLSTPTRIGSKTVASRRDDIQFSFGKPDLALHSHGIGDGISRFCICQQK